MATRYEDALRRVESAIIAFNNQRAREICEKSGGASYDDYHLEAKPVIENQAEHEEQARVSAVVEAIFAKRKHKIPRMSPPTEADIEAEQAAAALEQPPQETAPAPKAAEDKALVDLRSAIKNISLVLNIKGYSGLI